MPENVGSAHIQGIETELSLHPALWLTVQATWTFTVAKDVDDGVPLLRRPRDAGSLNAKITPYPGVTIAPELLYTGAFEDYLVDDGGNSTGDIVTSPHGLIANITVTYDFSLRVQLYTTGTNIFDSKFEPVNGYQIPGPTFLAGIRVKL
jgi:vitamin B12 transporter